jgi:exodeoxyribonuclease V alpha subunit
VGEFLRLRGRWSAHPRYGRQFEVHFYATVLPATAAGIQKYLGSGLIKGIGLASPYMGRCQFGLECPIRGRATSGRPSGVTGRRHG